MNILKKVTLIVTMMAIVFAGSFTSPVAAQTKCGGTGTQIIKCDEAAGIPAINALIRIIVLVMTILIGILATGGIAYAAIMYASARDSQAQVDQSKTIIRNIIIGLLLYVFMVAIINWLVPGSVIG